MERAPSQMKKMSNLAPLEAKTMLDLQRVCPESQCLRHSPAHPPGDRCSMRLSG
jgi:hypothetical protein